MKMWPFKKKKEDVDLGELLNFLERERTDNFVKARKLTHKGQGLIVPARHKEMYDRLIGRYQGYTHILKYLEDEYVRHREDKKSSRKRT